MSLNEFFGLLAGLIVIGATIPYIVDVIKDRVKPVRSTRLMFLLLLTLALFQQKSIGSGLSLFVTIGELVSTVLLFGISMKKGVGGLSRLDISCYVLLGLSMGLWAATNNALGALVLTIVADLVAFFPVIWRTAHDPYSETQIFYWGGVIGPLFGIMAEQNRTAQNLVFIIYLAFANLLVVLLINRKYLSKNPQRVDNT